MHRRYTHHNDNQNSDKYYLFKQYWIELTIITVPCSTHKTQTKRCNGRMRNVYNVWSFIFNHGEKDDYTVNP